MKKILLSGFLCFVCLVLQTSLHAQTTVNPLARSYAATCANCHGMNGVSAGGAVPSLAGLDAVYITAQMKAFQAGTRPSTVMQQLAKGYTDAQIELIAAYFAAQKK